MLTARFLLYADGAVAAQPQDDEPAAVPSAAVVPMSDEWTTGAEFVDQLCRGASLESLMPDHWAWDACFKDLVRDRAKLVLAQMQEVRAHPSSSFRPLSSLC